MATRFGETLSRLPRPSLSLGVGLAGAALVLASVALPWFQIPVASSVTIGGRAPRAVLLFRALALAALVGFVLASFRRQGRGRLDRLLLARGSCAWIGLLLFFPHVIMVWCPTTAGRALWLHTLHESLTWFGGDVFGLQETKDIAWKGHVVVADVLEQATAMNLPTWSPSACPFGNLRATAEWFGYSNSFCQFARSGWGYSMLGGLLLFAAACRRDGGTDVGSLRAGAAVGASVVATGLLLGLAPAAFAATELDRARDAAERGEYAVALSEIDMTTRLVPVLAESSDLALERGLLEDRLGKGTARASLYKAKVLQGLGRFEEAEVLFGRLVDSGAPDAVAREATRGLLRRGLRELNAGEPGLAIETLQGVMHVDPCNVKANYVLQLAYLRAGRYREVKQLAGEMGATYRFFRDQTKFPILAAAQENVAYSEYLDGDPDAAGTTWQALGDPRQLEP